MTLIDQLCHFFSYSFVPFITMLLKLHSAETWDSIKMPLQDRDKGLDSSDLDLSLSTSEIKAWQLSLLYLGALLKIFFEKKFCCLKYI